MPQYYHYTRITCRFEKKSLNSYHQVEPAFLWYINIIGCYRQLALAYFIYSITFDREFDMSSSCYDVCLYRTNTKDQNNAGDEILTFKLYGITGYLSLY